MPSYVNKKNPAQFGMIIANNQYLTFKKCSDFLPLLWH